MKNTNEQMNPGAPGGRVSQSQLPGKAAAKLPRLGQRLLATIASLRGVLPTCATAVSRTSSSKRKFIIAAVVAVLAGVGGMLAYFGEEDTSLEARAARGDADALYNQGCLYFYEYHEGREKDPSKAAKCFRKAAEQGHVESQKSLAMLYNDGIGVERNEAEAVKWYRKAAKQGDAVAQFQLGVHYHFGRGVSKDEATADKWWRKAAEQGHPVAQYLLGMYYAHGWGGAPEDFQEAAKWWRKAAEQGHAEAQFKLAACYWLGKGVEQNALESINWCLKAAKQGQEDAIRFLNKIGYESK